MNFMYLHVMFSTYKNSFSVFDGVTSEVHSQVLLRSVRGSVLLAEHTFLYRCFSLSF